MRPSIRVQIFLFLILLSGGVVSCAHLERSPSGEASANAPVAPAISSEESPTHPAPKIASEDLPPIPLENSESIADTYDEEAENSNESDSKPELHADFAVKMNSKIRHWIRYFTEKDRERFQRFLDRGSQYKDVVETVLNDNELPPQLYYLAMVESGYRTEAKSHAKAVGVWQFIAGTAKRYGLKVDHTVDERRDPIRATEAAAKYLRDLYNVFGSWHLAMAAYNAGEIRVLRAVFKGRTRSFWELVEAGVLPKETAEYVPKILAVAKIGEDPKKYGFTIDDKITPYPALESVALKKSMSLKKLSIQLGLPYETLKKVNPQLLTGKIPYNGYEIWVPQASTSKIDRKAIASPSDEPPVARSSVRTVAQVRQPGPAKFHTVRKGETLLKIASKYKVSVGHMMRINHLTSSKIWSGQKLRTQVQKYSGSKLVEYKVKRGENLTTIAAKFGTTVQQIRRNNTLFKNKLGVGQKLKIRMAQDGKGDL